MSSDDEMHKATSLVYPPQTSAGGPGQESPKFENTDDGDQRGSLNGNISQNTTANDIANSDERVRQVLFSDVRSVPLAKLMRVDWAECAIKSTEARCRYLQGIVYLVGVLIEGTRRCHEKACCAGGRAWKMYSLCA